MSEITFSASLDTKLLDSQVSKSNQTIKQWSDGIEAAGTKVDQSFNKLGSSLKQQIQEQQAYIKGLTKEIKDMEKAVSDATAGKGKQSATNELAQAKRTLSQEQSVLLGLQEKQIAANKAEENATNSLTGSISKWALSLGGAAAILGTLKNALLETTGGLNAFNIIGAITKQVMNDIVTGVGINLANIQNAIQVQKQLNAMRLEEKIESHQAAIEMHDYYKYYAQSIDQTKSSAERLKSTDQALAAHNKAIDIEVEHTKKMIEVTKQLILSQPDNEKLKMQFMDLNTKLITLDTQRESQTKRLISQRSGYIKDSIDEELKWRTDLHDNLQKLAGEQIEINNSVAEQEKLLQQAVKDGNIAEVLAINNKIKLLQKELDIRINIAKAALLTEAGGVIQKITHIPGAPTLSTKPVLPGLQEASANAQAGADLGKARQWNADDTEELKEQLKIRDLILENLGEMAKAMGNLLGMTKEESEALSSMMEGFAQGGFAGFVMSFAQQFISSFASIFDKSSEKADEYAAQLERINILLERNQRLIDQSLKSGGAAKAYQDRINILENDIATITANYEAQFAKMEKDSNKWINAGPPPPPPEMQAEIINRATEQKIADLEAAKADYQVFMSGGVVSTDISSAIRQGFENGETSAADFADMFNGFMTKAINSSLEEMSRPAITEWYAKFAEDMASGGGLDESEKANLKAQWDKIIAEGEANRQAAYDVAGISPTIGNAAQSGMVGTLQRSITEETGTEWVGLARRQADDLRLMRDYSREGVSHLVRLAAIEMNTGNTVVELQRLNGKTDTLISNTKQLYTVGP